MEDACDDFVMDLESQINEANGYPKMRHARKQRETDSAKTIR